MKNLPGHAMGIALSLLSIAGISGCAQDPPAADNGDGVVGLALQVGPGVVITSANYAIINSHTGFTSSGTVSVGKSPEVPVPIAGLPIADAYSITVIANAGDGITVCSGMTGFDVRASSRSTVIVHLVCREPPRTGSIQVSGPLNVCPSLDGLSASPDRVTVGGTASLTATAHDTDNAPGTLTYTWSTTTGALNSTTSPAPTFTCTGPGTAIITVVVSDGDPTPTCADRLDVNVNCTVGP